MKNIELVNIKYWVYIIYINTVSNQNIWNEISLYKIVFSLL